MAFRSFWCLNSTLTSHTMSNLYGLDSGEISLARKLPNAIGIVRFEGLEHVQIQVLLTYVQKYCKKWVKIRQSWELNRGPLGSNAAVLTVRLNYAHFILCSVYATVYDKAG